MSDAEDRAPEGQAPDPSFARIEAGDIPLSAERRLSELRESGGSYTSDLSIADLALCRQVGLRPLSQVMGSSIYQVGYQQSGPGMGYGWGAQLGGGLVTELSTISEAWNEARDRALSRLAREAQEVGADAVVGVQIRAGGEGSATSMAAGAIEYSLLGTAVARERARSSEPVLTELTVADYSKLVIAGIEPAGIVAWSSVFYANYAFGETILLGPGQISARENFELREFTQGFYAAREVVMGRLGGQAQMLGASGIVGVRLSHGMQPMSAGGVSRPGLMVTFHAIGTAIHDSGEIQPAAPEPIIDLTT